MASRKKTATVLEKAAELLDGHPPFEFETTGSDWSAVAYMQGVDGVEYEIKVTRLPVATETLLEVMFEALLVHPGVTKVVKDPKDPYHLDILLEGGQSLQFFLQFKHSRP